MKKTIITIATLTLSLTGCGDSKLSPEAQALKEHMDSLSMPQPQLSPEDQAKKDMEDDAKRVADSLAGAISNSLSGTVVDSTAK